MLGVESDQVPHAAQQLGGGGCCSAGAEDTSLAQQVLALNLQMFLFTPLPRCPSKSPSPLPPPFPPSFLFFRARGWGFGRPGALPRAGAFRPLRSAF
eukprot:scaffold78141_cov32-Tisochrysis_lutea.AAC.3